jgi:RNA polymerase sigma-70 factor (ECF subfamily)
MMGETRAELERLYREVGPCVLAYLRRRAADPSVAEELLQETFVAVAEDPASLERAVSERAWLIGIARNLLHRHFRMKGGRIGSTPSGAEAGSRPVPVPLDQVTEAESPEDPRVEAMRRAIDRLGETQREVLGLRLGQDLSYAEIAEALAIPIGTVRSRMHSAVGALRTWARETGLEKILEG